MKARLSNLPLLDGANPLLVVLQTTLPDVIFAIALCAIVAAIVSTADALMNGISANITQDFNIARAVSFNKLTISKITTLAVGILSLGASYIVPGSIIDIIISSYELSVSCLLVPLLFCYFKKDVKRSAAYVSITFGFIGFIIFRMYPVMVPKELMALALSLMGYVIGDRFKSKA